MDFVLANLSNTSLCFPNSGSDVAFNKTKTPASICFFPSTADSLCLTWWLAAVSAIKIGHHCRKPALSLYRKFWYPPERPKDQVFSKSTIMPPQKGGEDGMQSTTDHSSSNKDGKKKNARPMASVSETLNYAFELGPKMRFIFGLGFFAHFIIKPAEWGVLIPAFLLLN